MENNYTETLKNKYKISSKEMKKKKKKKEYRKINAQLEKCFDN